jgi:protein SCO1
MNGLLPHATCILLSPSEGERAGRGVRMFAGSGVPMRECHRRVLSRCPGRSRQCHACWNVGLVALACLFAFLTSLPASGQSLTPANLSRVGFDQKLNTQVSSNLPFRDEAGRDVKFGDYFRSKPIILVLGYYECPMLCTLTLNGMVESLEDIKWDIGNQFEVINVSINPGETPTLAAAKKKTYLRRYGRAGAERGWHFLTGDQPAIAALADEVGFRYAYDPAVKQYAHPAGLVILTPQGRVAKYVFGVTFTPQDLYTSLNSASGNHIGTRIEQLVLLCFHYSPIQGKYGPAIMMGVRSLGVVTLAAVLWLLVSQWRQSRAGGFRNDTRPHGPVIPVHHTEPLPFTATRDGHR